MADISDVRQALARIIGGLLYPAGVPTGIDPPSPIVGACCRVYAGWPERDKLDKDLAAGVVNVTVYQQGGGHNTSRYPKKAQVVTRVAPTLTWAISGNTVTLGGAVMVPQNLALIIDGVDFLYPVQTGDTLGSIAAAMTALIAAARTASVSGSTITVPNSHTIVARVGTVSTVATEVSRESLTMQIDIWAPTPALRTATGKAIQPTLRNTPRILLPDGFTAHFMQAGERDDDSTEKALLYRRISLYSVEYPTTITETAPQAIVWRTYLTPGTSAGAPTGGTPILIEA